MASKVQFLKGLSTDFNPITAVDGTIYFLTDTQELYIGGTKVTSTQDVVNLTTLVGTHTTDIANIKATLTKLEGDNTVDGSIKKIVADAIASIPDKVGELTSLKTTKKDSAVNAINELKEEINSLTGGAGSIAEQIKDVTGDLEDLETEADNLVEAINEVEKKADKGISDAAAAKSAADEAKTAAETAKTESIVTVEKETSAEEGYAHTYIIKQNGSKVGVSINIPKDLVVKSGRYDSDTQSIILTLNNEDTVTIPASQLVDVYTAENGADAKVVVTVDNDDNKISADLSASVKASLAKADSALQATDLEDYVKDEDLGDLAKKDLADLKLGEYAKTSELKDLAYKDEADLELSKYEEKTNLKGLAYKDEADLGLKDLAKTEKATLVSELDGKYDEKGAAETAKTDAIAAAKTYTDNALTWGTIQ